MQTLQELKNLIYDIEEELAKDGLSASEVNMQSDFMTNLYIDLRVNSYLGHIYVLVDTEEM